MIYKNLDTEALLLLASKTKDCDVTPRGVLYTKTGLYTGRCPTAKSIVVDKLTKDQVDWTNNKGISEKEFNNISIDFEIIKIV